MGHATHTKYVIYDYRSARIIKGNSIFSYPAPAQRKWLVVEGLKFFWGVFMAVETDCPNSFLKFDP